MTTVKTDGALRTLAFDEVRKDDSIEIAYTYDDGTATVTTGVVNARDANKKQICLGAAGWHETGTHTGRKVTITLLHRKPQTGWHLVNMVDGEASVLWRATDGTFWTYRLGGGTHVVDPIEDATPIILIDRTTSSALI